mmetsp:Transcript_52190/g.154056  ORF Transcript_52190/g.154056 Transcript_52190/m.154056 type:complete len:242 (-) Transcript_52190:293-1018(-)
MSEFVADRIASCSLMVARPPRGASHQERDGRVARRRCARRVEVAVKVDLAEGAFEAEAIAQRHGVHVLRQLTALGEPGRQREVDLDDELDVARAVADGSVRAHHGLAIDARLEEDMLPDRQPEVGCRKLEAQAERVVVDLRALLQRKVDPLFCIERHRWLRWGYGRGGCSRRRLHGHGCRRCRGYNGQPHKQAGGVSRRGQRLADTCKRRPQKAREAREVLGTQLREIVLDNAVWQREQGR